MMKHYNRKKISPIWNYFKRLSPGIARCNFCKKKFSFKTTISNLKRHILVKHNVNVALKITMPSTQLDSTLLEPTSLSHEGNVNAGNAEIFQINEVCIKDEPSEEAYDANVLDALNLEYSLEGSDVDISENGKNDNGGISARGKNRNNEGSDLHKWVRTAENAPQCSLQLNNADKDILFLLSLSPEMKRVPKEMMLNFKGELIVTLSRLVQKYQRGDSARNSVY